DHQGRTCHIESPADALIDEFGLEDTIDRTHVDAELPTDALDQLSSVRRLADRARCESQVLRCPPSFREHLDAFKRPKRSLDRVWRQAFSGEASLAQTNHLLDLVDDLEASIREDIDDHRVKGVCAEIDNADTDGVLLQPVLAVVMAGHHARRVIVDFRHKGGGLIRIWPCQHGPDSYVPMSGSSTRSAAANSRSNASATRRRISAGGMSGFHVICFTSDRCT